MQRDTRLWYHAAVFVIAIHFKERDGVKTTGTAGGYDFVPAEREFLLRVVFEEFSFLEIVKVSKKLAVFKYIKGKITA